MIENANQPPNPPFSIPAAPAKKKVAVKKMSPTNVNMLGCRTFSGPFSYLSMLLYNSSAVQKTHEKEKDEKIAVQSQSDRWISLKAPKREMIPLMAHPTATIDFFTLFSFQHLFLNRTRYAVNVLVNYPCFNVS